MASDKIPMLDLSPQTGSLWAEYMSAIENVVRGGRFILGPNVKTFEDDVAAYLGAKHAVGVNSGTDALVIAVRAAGIQPGDEVITTPFSFFATAECISHAGATPVFVDIDQDTFNLDVARAAEAITDRTKAILPAHMFGQAVDMGPLMELARSHSLKVIEDVAQAFGADYQGAKLGSLGDVGCFSFFPSKPLGGFGDGGLVVTDSDDVAESARMLRAHGATTKYHNEAMGYNSRLDELQAAILRVKLPHIDEWNAARHAAGQRYTQMLQCVPGIAVPQEQQYGLHVYHQYTVRILGSKRDAVRQALDEANVSSMVYYPVPIHKLPVYDGQHGAYEQAERAADEVLSLPIWPEIDLGTQKRVVEALARCVV